MCVSVCEVMVCERWGVKLEFLCVKLVYVKLLYVKFCMVSVREEV